MSEHVATVPFEGRKTDFRFSNPNDHIQSFHLRGEFYELRQLLAQRDLIPMGGTVLDVGANVGNHTMFYARYTWAKTVYPFEPNAAARTLLLQTIRANSGFRAEINLSYVQMAVGGEPCTLKMGETDSNNLGGTSFIAGGAEGNDAVDCTRLDDLQLDGTVSFVKIDVEGMEFDVLHGARSLIERSRPTIAIEVSTKHEPAFWRWLRNNNYVVVSAFFEYLNFKNYLVVPSS